MMIAGRNTRPCLNAPLAKANAVLRGRIPRIEIT